MVGRSRNGEVRAVLDSGAALSYVPADVVEGVEPIGTRSDFYPGFGEFETSVWRVRAEIGGRRVSLSAGVLPPALQMMFGLLLGDNAGSSGATFFRNRAIVIDYAGGCVVDITQR